MGLADDARQHQEDVRSGPKCRMCLLLRTLDPDTQTDYQEALDDPALQHTAIGEALRARGHDVSVQSVSRHRKGRCLG